MNSMGEKDNQKNHIFYLQSDSHSFSRITGESVSSFFLMPGSTSVRLEAG